MKELSPSTSKTVPVAVTEIKPAQELGSSDLINSALHHNNIQFKLKVGSPDDPLEQEADSMADTIMRMPEPGLIQRECSHCEEEDKKVQRKPLTSFIQRKEASSGMVASSAISDQINSSKGSGARMESNTRTFMESRFGADFSKVNIHSGNEAIQMNRDLNAKAFTVGSDIYFNEGWYRPDSVDGKHLLAHELTHTLQQGSTLLKSNNYLQKKEDKENDNLTRSQEIQQSIESPGEFEVLKNPIGLSLYNFAINKFELKIEHKKILNELGKVLKATIGEGLVVQIIGNADSSGTNDLNDLLSARRASSVMNYLAATSGKKYKTLGAGEDRPFVANESDTGRTRNRRVDILIDHPIFHQQRTDPKPEKPQEKDGLILPEAYQYYAPNEITRMELLPHGKGGGGGGGGDSICWFCGLPFLCLLCPGVCECLVSHESVYCMVEHYGELCGDKDKKKDKEKEKDPPDKKRRACLISFNLTPGEGEHIVVPRMDIPVYKLPVTMNLEFKQESEDLNPYCDCNCGEYRQYVRGFFKSDEGTGIMKDIDHRLFNRVKLDIDKEHEDGGDTNNPLLHGAYGHRYLNDGARQLGKRQAATLLSGDGDNDKFLKDGYSDREDGCSYAGTDEPGYSALMFRNAEVHFHLWFRGGAVDACNGNKEIGEWKEWEVICNVTPSKDPKTDPDDEDEGEGVTDDPSEEISKPKPYDGTLEGFVEFGYGGGLYLKVNTGTKLPISLTFESQGKRYKSPVTFVVVDIDKYYIILESVNEDQINLAPEGHKPIIVTPKMPIRVPKGILK